MAASNGHDEESADIVRRIEQLNVQLSILSKEVASLKGKPPGMAGSRSGARIA
jgi:hypothetical protein